MNDICSYGNCGNALIGTEELESGICSMHIEEKTEREIEEEKEYKFDITYKGKYLDTATVKGTGYADSLETIIGLAQNRLKYERVI